MKRLTTSCLLMVTLVMFWSSQAFANARPGNTINFNKDWRFNLGDVTNGQAPDLNDSKWRALNLPHDWSIEGEFSEKNPAGFNGGALPGGIGWYRKTFTLPAAANGKSVFVDFDGVYRNSEVWINGHYLGKRPYGYISFEYELTPYLNFAPQKNVVAVKVDNSQQPNSRWYSGSGIYRNVWLTTIDKVHVDHWGTYITTPEVSAQSAKVEIKTSVRNGSENDLPVTLTTIVVNAAGKEVARATAKEVARKEATAKIGQELVIRGPMLWSIENPYLYKVTSQVEYTGKVADRYETSFGI